MSDLYPSKILRNIAVASPEYVQSPKAKTRTYHFYGVRKLPILVFRMFSQPVSQLLQLPRPLKTYRNRVQLRQIQPRRPHPHHSVYARADDLLMTLSVRFMNSADQRR